MRSLIRYQKASDAYTVRTLAEPDYAEGDAHCVELCTLDDGYTYVAVPDDAVLPPQPDGIVVEEVEVTMGLDRQLRDASRHVRLINEQVVARIRAEYSVDDELKLNRIATGLSLGRYTPSQDELDEIDAFEAHVLACRQWGWDRKAELGLLPF